MHTHARAGSQCQLVGGRKPATQRISTGNILSWQKTWKVDHDTSFSILMRLSRVLQPKKQALRGNFSKNIPLRKNFFALFDSFRYDVTISKFLLNSALKSSRLWDQGATSLNVTQRCYLSFGA